MTHNCEFVFRNAAWLCVNCRWVLPGVWDANNLPSRNCRVAAVPCWALGQPREETYTLRQVCKTCNGQKESIITLIVHDCAKQGRCLPGWKCNNAISEQELAGEPATACRQCEFNPINRSPDNG